MSEESKAKSSHGWWIPISGFLACFVGVASQQGIPIMLTMIIATLGASMADAGQLTGMFGLTSCGFAFIWGFFVDKIGAKKVMTIAAFGMAISFALFGLIGGTSLFMACFLYGLIGACSGGMYNTVMPKLVGAWFAPQMRGRAMQIATPGGAVAGVIGGILIPILAMNLGWQGCILVYAGLFFIFAIIIGIVVKDDPSQMGQVPVGSPAGTKPRDWEQVKAEQKKVASAGGGTGAFVKALKTPVLWVLVVMFILYSAGYVCSVSFLSASIINAAEEYTIAQGGLAVTIFNVVGILGLQVWGWLSDKIERKYVVAIACAMYAVISVLYWLLYSDQLTLMYVLAALLGFAVNQMSVMLSMFADYFPDEIRGSANGIISTLALIGRYFGPVIAGIIVVSGGYAPVWAFAAACSCAAAVVALFLPSLRKKTQPQIAETTDTAA